MAKRPNWNQVISFMGGLIAAGYFAWHDRTAATVFWMGWTILWAIEYAEKK